MPSSPTPMTHGPIARAPLVRTHPPPPPLSFSATSSAFPSLTTPMSNDLSHRPSPQLPMSAPGPSLKSFLPRHLTGMHLATPMTTAPHPHQPLKRMIVHPPPLPPPPTAHAGRSNPPSPTHYKRKPTLKRIAELDYPMSAPLPHIRPSLAAAQYASLPVVPLADDPIYGTPPVPVLAYDVTAEPSPVMVNRRYRVSTTPPDDQPMLERDCDSPLPVARGRSLCPTVISTDPSTDDDNTRSRRAESAPPVRPPSPGYNPAVIYPSIPRIRSCTHAGGTHDCVLRSYELVMRQQPIHARMCGVGDKSDRRPIDPTPIIQLNVIDNADDNTDGKEGKRGLRKPEAASGMSHLQNPYYFLFACLVGPDDEEELHIMDDGKSRYLTGTPVSSLYHVKDENRSEVAFFVFPDLGVRKEGRYKLKLTLFEIVDQEVFYCATTFTEGFTVYSAKKFPGMRKATKLSQVVADQGLRIRVRKDPRKRSSNANVRSKRYSDSLEPSDEVYLHAPKRARYSADPHLHHNQIAMTERWSRDPGPAQVYLNPPPLSRMPPPPPPGAVSAHSARQALMAPDGRPFTPDAYPMQNAYAPQPPRSSGGGSERWSRSQAPEPARQSDPRTSARPSGARPPQSPLTAIHSSVPPRPDEYGVYQSSSRPSSRAAAPSELHVSHRDRPRSSLPLQAQPPSADSSRYAQMYGQQQQPLSAVPGSASIAGYPEQYSRRVDVGPPPFSAGAASSHSQSQSQSMLLPPPASRSRPHSPLREDITSHAAYADPVQTSSAGAYRSGRGIEELSPQMASTRISQQHPDMYQYSQRDSRQATEKDRYGVPKHVGAGIGLPPLNYTSSSGQSHKERDDRRDPYAPTSNMSSLGYGSKVDDWRQHQHQQQLHQAQAHTRHEREGERDGERERERHRRMESGDTSRSSAPGQAMTLPPLSSALSEQSPRLAHMQGMHGHSNSLSRSMTASGHYTPSLGRSSRDVSPATTPGGSKASGNRMGLGHLMD